MVTNNYTEIENVTSPPLDPQGPQTKPLESCEFFLGVGGMGVSPHHRKNPADICDGKAWGPFNLKVLRLLIITNDHTGTIYLDHDDDLWWW